MNENKNTKPTYLGHRDRVRARYAKTGIDSLAEHEILELILYYSKPRVDTKPLAYKLIEEFGSLEKVLSASVDSLKNAGLTENCAIHLNLFSQTQQWIENNRVLGEVLTDYDEIGKYLITMHANDTVEHLAAILLDSKNRLLDIITVSKGNFNNTNTEIRTLTAACIQKKCAKVILSHNHPAGSLEPSMADMSTTNIIDQFLKKINIEMVEHYVVTETGYIGVRKYAREHEGFDLLNK